MNRLRSFFKYQEEMIEKAKTPIEKLPENVIDLAQVRRLTGLVKEAVVVSTKIGCALEGSFKGSQAGQVLRVNLTDTVNGGNIKSVALTNNGKAFKASLEIKELLCKLSEITQDELLEVLSNSYPTE